jgi:glutathione S-transferase
MSALTLYHAPRSRSSVALWMLEEIGQPFGIHLLSIKKGDNREHPYLDVNPMGKVPALKHGDAIITEVAAICCYLADAFPQAGLNIPIGDPQRGPYLKWLFFAPGVIEPAIFDRAFPRAAEAPRAALPFGDFDTAMNVLAKAVTPVIGSQLRWATIFKLIPERKEFVDYMARFADRPAAKRAQTKDEQLANA